MCDPRDLGVSITEDIAGVTFEPNLYLYDNYPGGIGQSAPLFRLTPRLLEGAWRFCRVPVRIRLPELRGPDRRSGRARQGSRAADSRELNSFENT